MYIKYPHAIRRRITIITLGAASILSSLYIGVQSAGNVQPVTLIEAGTIPTMHSLDDVIRILEITQGYRIETPEDIQADPNGDGRITVDDALRILSTLSLR